MKHTFEPIGILNTDFREKFGVPRQSLMVSEARGVLKLIPDPSFRAALNHLETFTHVWVIFVFHKEEGRPWASTVQPPRFGLIKDLGVFASRSPRRPNPIGLSCLKLEKIDYEARKGIEVHFSGVDILDGTPVLDIKPYIPYADRVKDAGSGWALEDSTCYPVVFSLESLAALKEPRTKALLTQVLERDARPTGQRRASLLEDPANQGKVFAFRILELDVHWEFRDGVVHVLRIEGG